jgi:hypothetical protein
VSSTLQSLGMVSGLLVGGILADLDPAAAYVAYSVSLACAFVTMAALRYVQTDDGTRRSVSIAAVKEGLSFVWNRQVLLGAMSLDMFAVVFGGAAKGLLPIYAKDILEVGGFGYGLLFASMQIGALIMSVALVLRPPIYRTGRALVYSVVVFGALTMAFGLSRDIYLSIGLYMAIGAADQISVVMRNVIIQLATPDVLRGRVSSVNQVFIQASNQLGAMEAGFAAALTSATVAVVSGGAIAVGVAAIVAWKLRDLFDYVTPAHGHAVSHGPPPPSASAVAVAEAEEEHVAASG